MSEVMYLYAVADSDLVDADVTDMRAVDGAPVRIIAEAPIAAVVSAVDAERFSASALRRHLEDLHWLEGIARAHNAAKSPARVRSSARMFSTFTNTVASRTGAIGRPCASSETSRRARRGPRPL